MSPSIALGVFGLFAFWLFVSDAKRHPKMSVALWIPFAWLCIIGSRPVSLWLGLDRELVGVKNFAQDTLLDKGVFLVLIATGLLVLFRRHVAWRGLLVENKWLFVYFLYLAISVLWSDSPFVAFKRWIKDIGNIIMVLIVLSEEDPIESVRALLAKCAYLLIPLSVLVVKYYPALSREYHPWTGQPFFVGIATDKNLFGMTLFVCGVSLFWMLLELRDVEVRSADKTALFRYLVLMAMTAWLLLKSHSATALSCTLLGVGMLLGMRAVVVRNQVHRLGMYIGGLAVLVVILQVTGLGDLPLEVLVKVLGRDPSLHGRADIWRAVLKEDVNPLIGAGFYSFWSPERMQRLSQDYYYLLNEAHSGYVETYLNSGLIGLQFLILMVASAANKIKRDVLNGSSLGALRLVFLFTVLIYNITEAAFDRLDLVWFALLLVMMEYPRTSDDGVEIDELDTEGTHEPVSNGQGRFTLADCPNLRGKHWDKTVSVVRWKRLPLWAAQAYLPCSRLGRLWQASFPKWQQSLHANCRWSTGIGVSRGVGYGSWLGTIYAAMKTNYEGETRTYGVRICPEPQLATASRFGVACADNEGGDSIALDRTNSMRVSSLRS